MQVNVERTSLGLPLLNINDHLNYACAAQFFGAAVSWTRQQVGSPQVDGQVTVNRQRQMVQEQLAVEVRGDSMAHLRANVDKLVQAAIQDSYLIGIHIDGEHYQYQCEAADYQVSWVGSRFAARQLQVVLTVPRQPVPTIGVA